MQEPIRSPDDPELDFLARVLRAKADETDARGIWPREQLDLCAASGVFRWFLPPQHGGFGWNDSDVLRGYLKLSSACMTTAFVLTQRAGACRRIVVSENEPLQNELLPGLADGTTFATVGVSHLTTSRQHLAQPVLRATLEGEGYLLDGYSPWVTGATHADTIVMGATLTDDRQVLLAVPTDIPGVRVLQPERLIGLSASHTGRVECREARVPTHRLLAGPVENVMAQGAGARTGGLETSCLAVGLAKSAIDFLLKEAVRRPDLTDPTEALDGERQRIEADLIAAAAGQPACTPAELRARANSLALRASQSALAAAKGAGYVLGHPAGRWCREALFFLVWSCPQPVMNANLCELAGIAE